LAEQRELAWSPVLLFELLLAVQQQALQLPLPVLLELLLALR